jgi:hypothetical protein
MITQPTRGDDLDAAIVSSWASAKQQEAEPGVSTGREGARRDRDRQIELQRGGKSQVEQGDLLARSRSSMSRRLDRRAVS